jgi:long-subunit acyl-CoA synthetase (AMP-forming)
MAVMSGFKIGYYTGNPLNLFSDCQALKPAFFPSVPRIFNKLYGALKGQSDVPVKCKAMTGGKVRYLLTASAPIDPNVLRFLKDSF